jgi:hypothetical protein
LYKVDTTNASSTTIADTGQGVSLYAGTFVGSTLYGFSVDPSNDTIATIDTSSAATTNGPDVALQSGYDVVAAATLTAASVPEPGSLLLGLVGGVVTLAVGLFWRKSGSYAGAALERESQRSCRAMLTFSSE